MKLTNKLLFEFGFMPDRFGVPTFQALHINVDKDYACVRSWPIPVPKTVAELRTVIKVLGIHITALGDAR